MDLFFLNPLSQFSLAIYVVLFLGMFLEANVTIFAGSFLVLHNILNPGLIILLVIAGAFSEQYLLFWLGRHLGSKESLVGYSNKAVGRYDRHFTDKTFRSLLVSKFVYGLHRLAVLRCGMLKITWRHFTKATLTSTSIWLAIVFVFGLFFSASYVTLKRYFRYGGLVLLGLVILFFVSEYLISRRLKKDI